MLTSERKKQYRAIGHKLKPIVTIAGNGLSDAVMAEVDRALNDHELIKLKLAIAERDMRKLAIEEICQQTGATLVQAIGKTVLLHRAAAKPNPKLSNVIRPL